MTSSNDERGAPSREMRAIDLSGLAPPDSVPDLSPPPQLQWLEIALLRVDDFYQRAIDGKSRRHIERIAREFDWRRFGALAVSPVEGGFFAVIDGQHRAHAAALAGKKSVPCIISIMMRAEQAAAFVAMNSTAKRVHPLQAHRAGVAAGDKAALEIEAICADAGVRVLSSPKKLIAMAVGETNAVGALRQALATYGGARVGAALFLLARARRGYTGVISETLIYGLCAAQENAAWARGEALLANFDRINLYQVIEKARRDHLAAPEQPLYFHVACDVLRRLSANKSAALAVEAAQ